jgi:hypothetical protein
MAEKDIFQISANTIAIDFAVNKLRALTNIDIEGLLKELASLAGVAAEEYVVHYPPQRPPRPPKPRYSKKTGKKLKPQKRKRYKRTGVLGGSITSVAAQLAPLSWIAKVGTNIKYAPYVVGMPTDDPGQAWFHQGNWEPIQTSITNHIGDIIKVLEAELTRRMQEAFGV